MDKVDNLKIECMVCASCTFKGEKRQEERKIDRGGGDAGRGMSKKKETELSKNCKEQDQIKMSNTWLHV